MDDAPATAGVRQRKKEQMRLGFTRAAAALFGEQGFDQTTVTEIAERAGATERTFFRSATVKKPVSH